MMNKTVAAIAVGMMSIAVEPTLVRADGDVPPPTDREIKYSPYPSQDFPNRVYFGDTHLHTSYSTDAGMVGALVGPRRRLSFRARRESEVQPSAAGAASAPARFSRGLRPRRKPRTRAGDRRGKPRTDQEHVGQAGP